GGQPPRPPWPTASGSVSSETIEARVHPESGWATTPARHCDAGGQDRPARGGRGVERDLRGRLPRLLVRISAGTQPTHGAGCCRDRDLAEKGELGVRRRHP